MHQRLVALDLERLTKQTQVCSLPEVIFCQWKSQGLKKEVRERETCIIRGQRILGRGNSRREALRQARAWHIEGTVARTD